MRIFGSGSRRSLVAIPLVALAAALGTTGWALTASNTVPNSNAGDGTGTVSGYTVSAIAYGLNATTPNNIDTVSFTIAPAAAGTVKAKMDGNWYTCTNTTGSISCPTTTPQLTVGPLTSLQALVVQ